MDGGVLHEKVVFENEVEVDDGYGGKIITWAQQHVCRAQFIYHRGTEDVENARLQGQKVYKVKIRSCDTALTIEPDYRMTDARRGTIYNVREVDGVTDRAWVYLVVESGVST